MRLLPLTLVSLLACQSAVVADEWFFTPKLSTKFTAKTTRDTTADTAMGTVQAEKNVNADRDLNSYGFALGKRFDSWRAYANYDTFNYEKKASKFADKDVDGWVVTANADYLLPVAGPVFLFAGATLTVAGTKPEGMTSDPAPGYGGQFGLLADVYKTDAYRFSLEAGYRRIYTQIKAEETDNPEVLGALTYALNPLPVNGVKVETETTELSNVYFGLSIGF
jgi:hypothetical protein